MGGLENIWSRLGYSHQTLLLLSVIAIAAYLIGSLNFGILLSKTIKGEGIRQYGSGNAGTTNALRSYGKSMAVAVLLGDILKGVLAVLLGGWILQLGLSGHPPLFGNIGSYCAGAFVLLGHVFPLYFALKGGKGVATAFGVLLVLDYRVALMGLLVFVMFTAISRMVSVGSLVGALSLPFWTLLFLNWNAFTERQYLSDAGDIGIKVGFMSLLALILVVTHRKNIVRIILGKEDKLSFRSKSKNKTEEG